MAWTPKINVVDLTPVIDNLLAYIEANQTDALAWAHGGPGLDDFAAIYPNASGWLRSLYPYLMVLTHADRGEEGTDEATADEMAVSVLSIRFEVVITGTADELPEQSKEYDQALRSMLMNIPAATLTNGCMTLTRVVPPALPSSVYDVLRPGIKPTQFMQIFQTVMEYTLATNLVEN